MEELLKRNRDADLRVLVVWEPILPTDWGKPSTSVLGRIADSRAVQFWDRHHLVASELKQALCPQGAEADAACVAANLHSRNGTLWDLAILFPKQVQWTQSLPPPSFVGGPVLRVTGEVETKLGAALSGVPASFSRSEASAVSPTCCR